MYTRTYDFTLFYYQNLEYKAWPVLSIDSVLICSIHDIAGPVKSLSRPAYLTNICRYIHY